MNTTYILPYYHSYHNFNLLREITKSLLIIKEIDVLIVEVGKDSHISNYDFMCRKIFLESENWNLSWIYNTAMQYVKTEYVILSNLSIIPNTEILNISIDKCSKKEMSTPIYLCESVVHLDREESMTMKFDSATKEKVPVIDTLYALYNRVDFEKYMGWDENLYGEDMYKFQSYKYHKVFNRIDKSDSFVYLLDVDKMSSDSENSSKHLEKLMELDDKKLSNYLNATYKRIGQSNKYHVVNVQ